ncbi:hypothetical protein E4N87_08830 [Treponema denticola]|uniref:Uncharacterized protein n=1 Tax=Treponema denticola TaxID=158 RepID=A0A9Q9BL92_TREDN|nr:hypothetical protein [Treponema denticola]UTC90785.1 hypothetical protein E4N87_08830 [Treponema denticola]UTC99863.1 hypothetical protein E4N86_03745 [Treponema denticola]
MGIEDKKIIEYSKEELIELSNDDKPFMFSVFLEDTHSTGDIWMRIVKKSI